MPTLRNHTKGEFTVNYEIHPLAEAMPAMNEDEFTALTEDMRENGWKGNPVELYEGKILDGRSRYKAWQAAGRAEDIPTKEFSENGEPVEMVVIRWNINRRQLKPGQKVLAVLQVIKNDHPSCRGLARMAGVSYGIANSGIKVWKYGGKELCQRVFAGAMTVSQAAKLCDMTDDDRQAELEKIDDEPAQSDPEKTRSEIEADKNRTAFYEMVEKVNGNGCYTRDSLSTALECNVGAVTHFIRSCDISAHVEVFRTYGGGHTHFQFRFDSEISSVWQQVAEYLERIGNRHDSSPQDRIDATAAIEILSRN